MKLSAWISCKTFGISILGGLFRFNEEEREGIMESGTPKFVSDTKEESLAIVKKRENGSEVLTAIKYKE